MSHTSYKNAPCTACQQRTILMRTILSYTTSEFQEELFIILFKSNETVVIKALGRYRFQDERGTYVFALEPPSIRVYGQFLYPDTT